MHAIPSAYGRGLERWAHNAKPLILVRPSAFRGVEAGKYPSVRSWIDQIAHSHGAGDVSVFTLVGLA